MDFKKRKKLRHFSKSAQLAFKIANGRINFNLKIIYTGTVVTVTYFTIYFFP